MTDERADRAARVVRALADLAPSTDQHSAVDVVPLEWFRWLPLSAVALFSPTSFPSNQPGVSAAVLRQLADQPLEVSTVRIDRDFGERLAAVDQIRAEQRSLRAGWLFVAGRVRDAAGRHRRVLQPLVTVPVRVRRTGPLGSTVLVPAGDVALNPLIADPDVRSALYARLEFGGGAFSGTEGIAAPEGLLARLVRLHEFAAAAAGALGFEMDALVPARQDPEAHVDQATGTSVVAGVAVYAIHETGGVSRAASLRAWGERPLSGHTALHALYVDVPGRRAERAGSVAPRGDAGNGGPDIVSPLLLTPAQCSVVQSARTAPVTVVSGAPGTGKSHTVAAIACDALARGEHVLLAAKTDATIDALLDLLERTPGPSPVVFGSSERTQVLARALAEGLVQPETEAAVDHARSRLATARGAFAASLQQVRSRLAAEISVTSGGGESAFPDHRASAPRLFASSFDLDAFASDLSALRSDDGRGGWWARRRWRKRLVALARRAGARPEASAETLSGALEAATTARAAARLRVEGGLDLDAEWGALRRLDDEARREAGAWLAVECRSEARLAGGALGAVAALASALRAGRAARRVMLARIDPVALAGALPLWVGTLADADDLLPPEPAMFDLVVLDEASAIDQSLAAPALLRAARAVIVGDPHQLRHVSFLSDDEIRSTLAAHGLDGDGSLAARLDVRRNSLFDLGLAAVAPVVLDEHFRSAPQLVEFVARRLYDGRVKVATRNPRTEAQHCVDVVRVAGRRDRRGVVREEVERVVAHLGALTRDGARSVGVVTPFRAQADALEQAILAAFTADDLERLDLRIGTAHAFQGNERDVVLVSVGVGPDDTGATWRFVDDPHLFAVLVTRARRRLTLVLSADPPPGLFADYLTAVTEPPGRPAPLPPARPWATEVARGLGAAGLDVVSPYPAGRHVVDVAIYPPVGPIGLECGVHPDGPDAHIDRHLALLRAGWDLRGVFESRWAGRTAELVVELLGDGAERPTGTIE